MQGLFPETDPLFLGVYWGQVSTPYTAESVESASAYLVAGPLFNDYNTVAFTTLVDEGKIVTPLLEGTPLPCAMLLLIDRKQLYGLL